jgi:hypothetical protein
MPTPVRTPGLRIPAALRPRAQDGKKDKPKFVDCDLRARLKGPLFIATKLRIRATSDRHAVRRGDHWLLRDINAVALASESFSGGK